MSKELQALQELVHAIGESTFYQYPPWGEVRDSYHAAQEVLKNAPAAAVCDVKQRDCIRDGDMCLAHEKAIQISADDYEIGNGKFEAAGGKTDA